MLAAIQLRLKDSIYAAGLFFLVLSLVIFCIPLFSNMAPDTNFGIFALNFAIAGGYFLVLWGNGRLKRKSRSLHTFFIFLLLFLISAYSLNREMSVFEDSTTWFSITLLLVSVNYLAFSYLSFLPVIARHIMSFVLGISTLVFIYLAVYLFPFYGVGIAAFFVLGISLHTFVPLLFSIYSIVLVRKISLRHPSLLFSFSAGIVCVVTLLAVFIIKWNGLADIINHEYRDEAINGDESLPAWVRVSQKMPKGWLTEKILKTGIVYSVASGDDPFFRMPQRNFGEERKHDPFVIISSLFTAKVQLSENEKINILKSMYDSRHEAEERLWSGEHLTTDHVNTNIKLWPEYRMAYTEKVITVSNTAKTSWPLQEEAIYTFHLTEGSVVTSLSLWIDGKEAKGILTTKEKAARAYNTIVGTERRDPSVIHWQEGNRVSVRVFPVVSNESRMFKVGITSPLQLEDNKLHYSNIYFDGPSVNAAKEDVKLICGNAADIDVPDDFKAAGVGTFTKEGKYHSDWQLSCNNAALSPEVFNFNGYSYAVAPYKVQRAQAQFDNVYLDINASWTDNELQEVYELVKGRNVYVYDEHMQKVTDENHTELFGKLQQQRFSLFPFYKVHQPGQSLVITKNTGTSPVVEDLKGSDFYTMLGAVHNKPFKLFNLSFGLSPYLQSLKESRWFQYEQGSMTDLNEIIKTNAFAAEEETDSKVIVHSAGIALTKAAGPATKTNAPDHLMRLFAYNHIMKETGEMAAPDSSNEQVVTEAQQAYVVSPVSSLVVLETAQDYERFDIKDSETSLHNASSKSTGAVPEPHEWALIIMAVLVALYVRFPHLFKRLVTRP